MSRITKVSREAFPVNSIFISVSSTNPSSQLGYGVWSTFGAGKILISLDSEDADFDTSEETGGAKTTTIAASNLPQLAVEITDPTHSHDMRYTTGASGTIRPSKANGAASQFDPSPVVASATGITATANTGGANTAISRMNPYIVVYMWKRVS